MFLKIAHVLAHPLVVREHRFEVVVYIGSGQNLSVLEVDTHHLSRLQSAALYDHLFRQLKHAVFRRDQQSVVRSDNIFCRPEPVSVKYTANVASVGHTDRCRAVPWLETGTCIFVEGFEVGIHQRRIVPRCGDE